MADLLGMVVMVMNLTTNCSKTEPAKKGARKNKAKVSPVLTTSGFVPGQKEKARFPAQKTADLDQAKKKVG